MMRMDTPLANGNDIWLEIQGIKQYRRTPNG